VNFTLQFTQFSGTSNVQSDTAVVYASFRSKPTPVLTMQNIQDGVYFSCRDLYLNQPGVVPTLSFPDTALIGKEPVVLSSSNYVIDKAFALVKNKRIFIYIREHNYKEAMLGEDGKLFFPYVTSWSNGDAPKETSLLSGASISGLVLHPDTKKLPKVPGPNGGLSEKDKYYSDLILDYETADLRER
jgi:hypothetical protein